MSTDAASEAALFSFFCSSNATSESIRFQCGQRLVCVVHIKGRKTSSSASGTASILSQAASTTVRTERHFHTSVLTNASPVWNAICTAVLIPQQHVRNYLDEVNFYSFY